MSKAITAIFFPILLLSPLLFPSALQAWSSRHTARVIDGDTIVLEGKKIRLLGVDTPEMARTRQGLKEECYALEAKLFLQSQLSGKKIKVKGDSKAAKRDRFGRELAWLYVAGRLINQEIIAEGYGFAVRNFPNSKKSLMIETEARARKNRKGVWHSCSVSCEKGYCEVKVPVSQTPRKRNQGN